MAGALFGAACGGSDGGGTGSGGGGVPPLGRGVTGEERGGASSEKGNAPAPSSGSEVADSSGSSGSPSDSSATMRYACKVDGACQACPTADDLARCAGNKPNACKAADDSYCAK